MYFGVKEQVALPVGMRLPSAYFTDVLYSLMVVMTAVPILKVQAMRYPDKADWPAFASRNLVFPIETTAWGQIVASMSTFFHESS